jgi:hypothetical protein
MDEDLQLLSQSEKFKALSPEAQQIVLKRFKGMSPEAKSIVSNKMQANRGQRREAKVDTAMQKYSAMAGANPDSLSPEVQAKNKDILMTPEEFQTETYGTGQALARFATRAGDSASFGMSDELKGLGGAARYAVSDEPLTLEGLQAAYESDRDAQREVLDTMNVQAAGAGGLDYAAPEVAQLAMPGSFMKQGASRMANTGRAALGGATGGFFGAEGGIAEHLKGTALGTLFGGTFGRLAAGPMTKDIKMPGSVPELPPDSIPFTTRMGGVEPAPSKGPVPDRMSHTAGADNPLKNIALDGSFALAKQLPYVGPVARIADAVRKKLPNKTTKPDIRPEIDLKKLSAYNAVDDTVPAPSSLTMTEGPFPEARYGSVDLGEVSPSRYVDQEFTPQSLEQLQVSMESRAPSKFEPEQSFDPEDFDPEGEFDSWLKLSKENPAAMDTPEFKPPPSKADSLPKLAPLPKTGADKPSAKRLSKEGPSVAEKTEVDAPFGPKTLQELLDEAGTARKGYQEMRQTGISPEDELFKQSKQAGVDAAIAQGKYGKDALASSFGGDKVAFAKWALDNGAKDSQDVARMMGIKVAEARKIMEEAGLQVKDKKKPAKKPASKKEDLGPAKGSSDPGDLQ